MLTVTICDAKTNLSKLIARVEAGEEIVIARGRTPVARLTPIRPPSIARRFGALKGVVSVGSEFFEPLRVPNSWIDQGREQDPPAVLLPNPRSTGLLSHHRDKRDNEGH
jgi:prevent-host-death family protein